MGFIGFIIAGDNILTALNRPIPEFYHGIA
jgi:hypothetical protein